MARTPAYASFAIPASLVLLAVAGCAAESERTSIAQATSTGAPSRGSIAAKTEASNAYAVINGKKEAVP